MLYVQKFYEKTFKAKKSKDAYMKACKFVASNVVSKASKVEAAKVTWEILKEEEADLPTFRLVLYAKFDDTEFMKQTCQACKDFHCSFFVNENYNCDRCNKVGYEKNVQQKLGIVTDYLRKILDNELSF